MAIANLARPLNGGTGTGSQQQIPLTGFTPPQGVQNAADYNKWLKSQPWYQSALQSWGLNPNDPTLNVQQRAQLSDALGRAGVLPQSAGIDQNGQVEATGVPWWQWALLAAGPATLGVTSLLSGGGAAASGLSSAGSGINAATPAAGDLASSTIAPALGTLPNVAPSVANVVAPAVSGGGGVAPAATSWLTSPTASLIGTAANVFGQIYGTNQQQNANAQAAQIQAQEFDKALAQQEAELNYQHGQDTNTQNQYAAYLSRLGPYAQTGQAANNSLAQYTGLPQGSQTPLSPTLNQPPANPYTPVAGSQQQQQQSAQQSSASSFVPNAVAHSPTASQVSQAPGPYANWPVLQAPDGSKRRVSPDKVQQALAAGATMVNS